MNGVEGRSQCAIRAISVSTSMGRLGATLHKENDCISRRKVGYWTKGRNPYRRPLSTIVASTTQTNDKEGMQRGVDEALEEGLGRSDSTRTEKLALEGPIVDLLTPFSSEGDVDFTALQEYLQVCHFLCRLLTYLRMCSRYMYTSSN